MEFVKFLRISQKNIVVSEFRVVKKSLFRGGNRVKPPCTISTTEKEIVAVAILLYDDDCFYHNTEADKFVIF